MLRGPMSFITVYAGPPLGIYSPEGFDVFVKRDIRAWMHKQKIPHEFNVEEKYKVRTYHFMDAQTCIEYVTYGGYLCGVQLKSTPGGRRNLNGLAEFVIKTQMERKLGIE